MFVVFVRSLFKIINVTKIVCCFLPIFGCHMTVGSRPSDHYFRSVCLSVCFFVQSFSQPSLIRFRSNLDICLGLVVSP